MTPKQLEKIGRQRHGLRWKSALGRELDITYVQMNRYMNGETPIPKTVELALVGLQILDIKK